MDLDIGCATETNIIYCSPTFIQRYRLYFPRDKALDKFSLRVYPLGKTRRDLWGCCRGYCWSRKNLAKLFDYTLSRLNYPARNLFVLYSIWANRKSLCDNTKRLSLLAAALLLTPSEYIGEKFKFIFFNVFFFQFQIRKTFPGNGGEGTGGGRRIHPG